MIPTRTKGDFNETTYIRMNKDIIKKSKHLAYLLRHDKEYEFDKNGWREVRDLVHNHGYTEKELEEIVKNNNKQRYEFNTSHTKIRARQGHSIIVDVELQEAEPPKILYHGTSTKFLKSIFRDGINGGKRLFVHLSHTKEIAYEVGLRHGSPYILEVNCEKMVEDGIKFYLSRNGVWLTKYVDVKYIKV